MLDNQIHNSRFEPLRRKKTSADDNMIPLINIVFLLLIFFMVAGKIVKQPDSAIELPTTYLIKDVADNEIMALSARLELLQDGSSHFNGESIHPAFIMKKLIENDVNKLSIFADKNMSFGQLNKLTEQFKTLNHLKVTLYTLDKSQ